MATLDPTPYPLADLDFSSFGRTRTAHEEDFETLLAASNALADDQLLGAMIKFQVADGYAWYRVSKTRPLTLQHVPFMDAWSVHPAMIRGLRASDITQMLAGDRSVAAFLSGLRR